MEFVLIRSYSADSVADSKKLISLPAVFLYTPSSFVSILR